MRDVAVTHARFVGYDSDQAALYASLAGFPEAQIGNAPGNYIPNAPAMVASAGITVGEKTGWFGTLRWRYLASSPLTEDNVFRSPATSLSMGAWVPADNGWRIQLDVLNLLNTQNQPDHLRLRIADQVRLFVCNVVFLRRSADCARGRLSERRHGLCPASNRAVGGQTLLSPEPSDRTGRTDARPVAAFGRHQCERAAVMACDLNFGLARAPRRPSVSEGYSPNNE